LLTFLTQFLKRYIDFGQNIVVIRDSKGGKDRTVPLPKLLAKPLTFQIPELDPEAVYERIFIAVEKQPILLEPDHQLTKLLARIRAMKPTDT
jgi:integrase